MAQTRKGIKRRRRQGLAIYVLPNLLTTMNMFFGYIAIVQSIRGEFLLAAYAIVAAAVFDLLDGRVARIMRSTSQFGGEYDSLSDLVSFGVAPALLLYLWELHEFGRLGWLISFFFVACGALRLARYNVQAEVIEKHYFQGLPIPMAAGIVASSVLFFGEVEFENTRPLLLLLLTAFLAILMVSQFRYRNFKDLDLRHRLPFSYLVFGVGILALIALHPEVTFFILFLSYAFLGALLGIMPNLIPTRFRQKAKEGDDLHEFDDEQS